MKRRESSCGIIPLRPIKSGWEVLLVKHRKGHWAFPKGHPEPGESSEQTACRELKEETGLEVKYFLDLPELQERYFFKWEGDLVEKTVTYLIAEVEGRVTIQKEEILDFRWLSLKEAEKLATFPESKQLCQSVLTFLPDLQT